MDSNAFNRYLTSLGVSARVDETAVRDRPTSR